MGAVFLNDETKKDLNRIRPDVKLVRVKGVKGVRYSDIISFLVKFYKGAKK